MTDYSMEEEWEASDSERDKESTPTSLRDEQLEAKYRASQLRVVRETKDYQLDYLKYALSSDNPTIDIAPSYQRRSRWTDAQRSRLIESLMLHVPIPPIYLFEKDYNEYEVIDGRQRLESVITFLNDEFRLKGLEYWSELDGLRFSDLPKVLQKGLLRRTISAEVLLAETGAKVSGDAGNDAEGIIDVRRVLFDRLNTGGVRLNPQELRNALYPGKLNNLLEELARGKSFSILWGLPWVETGEFEELQKNPLYTKFLDSELVLRFFALRDAMEHQKNGSVRALLDRFSREHADIPDDEILSLRRVFEDAAKWIEEELGEDAFKLPEGRRSRPLYDALMIAVANTAKTQRNRGGEVRERLDEALSNSDQYEILVGRRNTIDAIRRRIELAESIVANGK
ncbi:DUF262 domain-containing protein [uncultured Corynebacterium sp.]|uniref:DUF262 domain-containing protein n=1 Tax=uncultured Corynebacterium sp. TaxID=159447 RepID=UPI00288A45B2|nr:DUF262 domain-containing protein [uncultured Corynebacterium sp.]